MITSLSQILSRDIDFYHIVATQRLFQNRYPNPIIGLHPNPNPKPNPNQRGLERNVHFTGWSRDQNSFCP